MILFIAQVDRDILKLENSFKLKIRYPSPFFKLMSRGNRKSKLKNLLYCFHNGMLFLDMPLEGAHA